MQFTAIALAAIAATSAYAQVHNGVATYFYQNGNAGSCGQVHSDAEFLIAMSPEHGHNAHCGRMVTIKNVGGGINNQGTGKTITAMVADTCPSDECNLGHLDLSTGAFTTLTGGPLDPPGKINIQWWFN